jgi:exosortase H (IPTLxxWG-CTERM-specific)
MFRFVLIFLVCLLILFPLDLYQPVQQHVILPLTSGIAHACVAIMKLWDGHIAAEANIMRNTLSGGGIVIVAGCSGVEAVIILISAVLAFPSPWKYKLIGIGAGFVAIQSLNVVRLISLYYLNEWNQVWFEWFHLYLWQALIILDALVFWLIWLRWLPREPRPPQAPPPAPPLAAAA